MKKIFILIFLLCFSLLTIIAGPQTIKVMISSNPPGASVYINNKSRSLAVTPFESQCTFGVTYTYIFVKEGYKEKIVDYYCDGRPLNVSLEPIACMLSIKSNVDAAEVYINGTNYGVTPLSQPFQPGNYDIMIKSRGYKTYQITVMLDSDKTVFANLEPNRFKLSIKSNVNRADVYLNGSKFGNTPFRDFLDPKMYDIEVKSPGYKSYRITINLNTDQELFANLEPQQMLLINLPANARLWIDGKYYDTKEGLNKIPVEGNSNVHNVKIQYYDLNWEKQMPFNNMTEPLNLRLKVD